MSIDLLTFDAASHTYRHDGQVVPSVTQVLQILPAYKGVPADVLAKAAARGTAVHKATEQYDDGSLDVAALDDELLPYLDAYEQFLHDHQPETIAVESRVWHPLLRYAGTEDREWLLAGVRCSVDLKTCVAMLPGIGPQTAAYMEAKNQGRPAADKIKRRYGLQLKKDGSYALHPYKDKGDFNIFVACLTLHRFQEKTR